MGFTSILALIVIALIVVMIKLIVDGIKAKNWKKVIISTVVFCAVFVMMYFALIRFITAM